MEKPKTEKRSFIFDKLTEAIGWLQIVASPLLIGVGVAVGLYCAFPHRSTVFIAVGIVLIAFILGAIWATKIARRRGTVQFLSRINESPGLDERDDDL